MKQKNFELLNGFEEDFDCEIEEVVDFINDQELKIDKLKSEKEDLEEFEYVGDEVSIGLNINKLKTILTTLEEDKAVVYMSAFNKPMLFVEENTRILISPMIADKI